MAKAEKKPKKEKQVSNPIEPEEQQSIQEVEPTIEPAAEPIVEEPKEGEVVAPIKEEPPMTITVPKQEPKDDLPMDEKIISFLKSRDTGAFIKMNDFLKSLYKLPRTNEPPVWINQPENKGLRVLLDNMQRSGKIAIKDNRHLLLGGFYYPDDTTGKTHYHTINTVNIEAKLVG